MGHGRPWPLSTERIVKYIANSAAKNMSSLDNQMMVPTLTRFGRLAGVRGTGSVTDAVATKVIITTPRRGCAADPRFSHPAAQDIGGTGYSRIFVTRGHGDSRILVAGGCGTGVLAGFFLSR